MAEGREYRLDTAASYLLAAVRELRGYHSASRFTEEDDFGNYLLGRMKALQKLADKLNPPQEAKDGNVVQFVPRARTRNE